jgi:hypothetical protein
MLAVAVADQLPIGELDNVMVATVLRTVRVRPAGRIPAVAVAVVRMAATADRAL